MRLSDQLLCTLVVTSIIACAAPEQPEGARVTLETRSTLALDREWGEGIMGVEAGFMSHFEPASRRTLVDDDLLSSRRRSSVIDALAPSRTATELALDQIGERDRYEVVTLIVRLSDPAFDFARLTRTDDDERPAVLAERVDGLKASQDAAEVALAAIGAVVVHRYWITNDLVVRAPAHAVPALLAIPGVVELFRTDVTVRSSGVYDGGDIRNGTLTGDFLAAGFNGESGGRVSTPSDNLKIAVFEQGRINAAHLGWKDNASASSRIKRHFDCDDLGCTATTPTAPTGTDIHGTAVAWAAAGSIEQNQDPAITGSAAQVERSGTATEAEIHYFRMLGATCQTFTLAIQKAISEGVDILNMSLDLDCGFPKCDRSTDCCGLNAQMKAALHAGVLITASAGNCPLGSSLGSGCNLSYPGFRPETIAVTKLLSNDETVPYNSLSVDTNGAGPSDACHGPVAITLRSGLNVTTPGIDLAAPGVMHLFFSQAGADLYNAGTADGTSFAAPIVAGAAATLRHAFASLGMAGGSDARVLLVSMLMLGDASNGTAVGRAAGVSKLSGYGRLRMHFPSTSNLTAPMAWGWRTIVMFQGDEFRWPVGSTGPESASITGWKWAFTWFDDNMAAASDVVIDVLNVCPPGGGEVVVAEDISFSMRKRIFLTPPSIAGKCLEMRAKALQAPPNGVTVWSTDYYHSGANGLHLAN